MRSGAHVVQRADLPCLLQRKRKTHLRSGGQRGCLVVLRPRQVVVRRPSWVETLASWATQTKRWLPTYWMVLKNLASVETIEVVEHLIPQNRLPQLELSNSVHPAEWLPDVAVPDGWKMQAVPALVNFEPGESFVRQTQAPQQEKP